MTFALGVFLRETGTSSSAYVKAAVPISQLGTFECSLS
jgi:hypothetical protein